MSSKRVVGRSDAETVNAMVNSEKRWALVKDKIVKPWSRPDENASREGFPELVADLSRVSSADSFLGSRDHLVMLALCAHMNHLPAFDRSEALPVAQRHFDRERANAEFFSMTSTVDPADPFAADFARVEEALPSKGLFDAYAVLGERWLGSHPDNFFRKLDFVLDPNTEAIGFWINEYLKRVEEFRADVSSLAQARFEATEAEKTYRRLESRFLTNNESMGERLRVKLRDSGTEEERNFLAKLRALKDDFFNAETANLERKKRGIKK